MKKGLLKRVSFGLLAILPVVLSIITIIEKTFGREIALEKFYYSWWFISLWVFLLLADSFT